MTHFRRSPRALTALLLVLLVVLLVPEPAYASFLSPEAEDKLADFLAIVILFVVPIVLIVLFWLVHILPEKIAHKRHHPQFEAIRTLCLLSLVFGGLLWPLAWIWAYTKPTLYKMAYGTDKVVDGEEYPGEDSLAAPTESLRERFERLEAKGLTDADLKLLHADLDTVEAKLAGGNH